MLPHSVLAPPPSRTPRLHRRLGVAFGISITVGSTIGVGILRTPGAIAAFLPSAPLILLCWLLVGGYVLLSASSYAELTTMLPKAGGAFNYIRRAFGPYAGFVAGWFDFASQVLAPAIFSITLGEYTGLLLLPALAPHATAVAMGYLTLFVLLNLPGVRGGSAVQQLTSALKAVLLLGLAAGCFWAAAPAAPAAPAATAVALGGGALLIGFFKAIQLVLGAYDGWSSVSFFAEEANQPARNIPRAYFIGVLVIIGLYVLLNAAYLHVLPVATLAHSPAAAARAAAVAFGGWSGPVFTVLSLFMILSTLNASVMIPARVLFGLSRAGYFPAVATRVNAGGTPYVALLLCYALALAAIVTNTFEQIFALSAVLLVLITGGVFASLLRLHRQEPHLPRPYRAWGYPYVPGLALLVTGALLAGFAVGDPRSLLVVAALLLISYPAYRLAAGRAPALTTDDDDA